MLRVALPNKGALSETAARLFDEAGYHCNRGPNELVVEDAENDVEFFFLRPRDIAIYVGSGRLDLGVTGRDLVVDSAATVVELLPLNFGRSKFRFAAPPDVATEVVQLDGARVATSYPRLVERALARHGVAAKIISLDGAVETAVRLGVADAVADVVETGRTLARVGLQVFGEPLLESEAVLLARSADVAEQREIGVLLRRIQGVVVAHEYAMIEYDIATARLDQAMAITPGIESPTVSPLHREGWVAVKAMIRQRERNVVMDRLYETGARGVVVTDLRACRL